MELIGWISGAVYAAFLFVCIRGALALRKPSLSLVMDSGRRPSVTVVVPLRDEEDHALATLEALAKQDYSGKWEVICVDDRSLDKTPEILAAFCAGHPRFTCLSIPVDAPDVASPKKRALSEGFTRAKGEILMTTDADCLPPPGWIQALASAFDDGIGIVQGSKRISTGSRGRLARYQEVEVFGLVSIEAASFALGKPMLASAPSLAYRQTLYEAVGGFSGIEDTVSGDDDLLVRKMMRLGGFQVRFVPDPSARVITNPVATWDELLQQRARWASNGARYEEKGFVATLAGLYLFYAFLFFSPAMALLGWVSWSQVLLLWILNIGLNWVFLSITAPILGMHGLNRDHWWCEILHVPIVLASVPMGWMGKYRWK